MKNYYDLFIHYCMLTTSSIPELKDKKRLRVHNKAMTELYKLQEEMYGEPEHCSKVVQDLLLHEDDKVKVKAGAYCLNNDVHRERAIDILSTIVKTSKDKWIAYNAADVLKYCSSSSNTKSGNIKGTDCRVESKEEQCILNGVLKSLARNSIQMTLDIQPDDSIRIGSSKFGGYPDLPDELEWFRNPDDGTLLTFICQINFAEIKPFDVDNRLPENGILYFFYDCSEEGSMPWGFDPKDASGKIVFSYEGTVESLKRRKMPLGQEGKIFNSARLRFDCCMDTPDLQSSLCENLVLPEEERKYYRKMTDEKGDFRLNKMLGHSNNIQGGMELECELVSHGISCGGPEGYKQGHAKGLGKNVERWNLLMQIDSDEEIGMMWGDCGRLYLWITDEDLAKRRFEKTWVILQSS